MNVETVTCPCCGQSTPTTGRVRVSLNENLLWFGDRGLPLTARLTELAYILARRMPETVRTEQIIEQMWGASEGEYAKSNVQVAVKELRQRLAPIGLTIVNTWNVGYRMEIVLAVSRTERSIQPQGSIHASA